MRERATFKSRIQILVTGLLWSILSAVSFLYLHSPRRGWIFGALAFVFLASALFVPPAARALHGVLSWVAQAVVKAISLTLLGLIYYLVMTPLGAVLRWTGSLKTTKRADPALATYWIERPRQAPSPARYLRPF